MGTRRIGRRPGRRLTGDDHTRVHFSSCLTRPVATPAAQSLKQRGGRALRAARPRPHTGSLSPPSPQERPAVDAATRLDSAREAVRKGACTRGYRTPVSAGLIPYPNPARRPTSTRLASKDTGLVFQNTVCSHVCRFISGNSYCARLESPRVRARACDALSRRVRLVAASRARCRFACVLALHARGSSLLVIRYTRVSHVGARPDT